MDQLSMTGCLQRAALIKAQWVFPSLRFLWGWKMEKGGSLPASLRIVISPFTRVLFLGPGVAVGNGGHAM